MVIIGITLVGLLLLYVYLESVTSSSQSVPSTPVAKLVAPVTEIKDQLTDAIAKQKQEPDESQVVKIVYICSKCKQESVKSKKSPSKPVRQTSSVANQIGNDTSDKPDTSDKLDTSEKPIDEIEVHEKQIASANCRVVKKAPPGFHDVEYDDRDSEWYEQFYSGHPRRRRKRPFD